MDFIVMLQQESFRWIFSLPQILSFISASTTPSTQSTQLSADDSAEIKAGAVAGSTKLMDLKEVAMVTSTNSLTENVEKRL